MIPKTIIIRHFTAADADEAAELIADTYREFNLAFASPEDQQRMLGPFRFAGSADAAHRRAILAVLDSPIFLVAECAGEMAGVLRGRKERLASLFVREKYQRQGVGSRLVQAFEADMASQGVDVIRVAATLYAVPFYTALGYKRSTGMRSGWSFEGYGLRIQPMKKVL